MEILKIAKAMEGVTMITTARRMQWIMGCQMDPQMSAISSLERWEVVITSFGQVARVQTRRTRRKVYEGFDISGLKCDDNK